MSLHIKGNIRNEEEAFSPNSKSKIYFTMQKQIVSVFWSYLFK